MHACLQARQAVLEVHLRCLGSKLDVPLAEAPVPILLYAYA